MESPPLWLIRTLEGFAPKSDLDKELIAKWGVGSIVRATIAKPRSGKQHRFYWAILRVVWANQDHYSSPEAIHNLIKVRFGLVDHIVVRATGETILIPKSINYDAMEQGDFNQHVDRTLELIWAEVLPGLDKKGRDAVLQLIDRMTT